MFVRRGALLLICVASAASAGPMSLHWDADEQSHPLELDPVFQTQLDPLGAFIDAAQFDAPEVPVESHRIGIDLGDHTHATFSSAIWATNEELGLGIGVAHWHASGRLDHDFGHDFHLEVDASVMELAGELDGRYGRGTVAGVGVALTKYFHWSHGRIAWISLGVEMLSFLNGDPVGVPHGTVAGLRIGTTF
jgi:hypothetical protein